MNNADENSNMMPSSELNKTASKGSNQKDLTYEEKLKDPRWQKKRLRVFERDGWKCTKCGTQEETLHVHHKKYVRDGEPWDVPSSQLVTLCSECHENLTELSRACWKLSVFLKEKTSLNGSPVQGFLNGIEACMSEENSVFDSETDLEMCFYAFGWILKSNDRRAWIIGEYLDDVLGES
jgi:hypothetical protein